MVADTHRSLMEVSQSIQVGVKDLRGTARRGGKELTALLKELRQTNEELRKSLARVEEAVLPVLSQARSGLQEAEGLFGDARSVINDNDRNLYLLLLHLKEASRHLEALSKDLRAHPWKVLWKGEGTTDGAPPAGPAEWREKGRIGWHEPKQQ
jgi:predicted RNase H-like nuclease (RuvC/YqgF family)